MIVCGWCERPTPDGPSCSSCGHRDPRTPWEQRALPVPTEADHDAAERRRRLADARRQLGDLGQPVTNARLAELLGIDESTVRRWMHG